MASISNPSDTTEKKRTWPLKKERWKEKNRTWKGRYAGVSDLFSLEVVVTLRRYSGFVDWIAPVEKSGVAGEGRLFVYAQPLAWPHRGNGRIGSDKA
jgi:hypothetical protein